MTLNLRSRILLPTVLLVFTVATALSLVSFFISNRALDASSDAQLKHITDASLQQIESWVEGQRKNLVHWSAQPHLQAALQDAPSAVPARQVVSAELEEAFKLYGFFTNLQLVDLKGDTLSSSNPASVGVLNVADRQYFKDAVRGSVVVSEVLKSKSTGKPIVVIAAPVREGTAVRGVIFGSLDLNWFSANVIDRIKVLQSGYVFVYDEKGVFISHPQKELILKAKLADFPWGEPFLKQDQGEIYYTFDGVEKMVWFKRSESLHWGVGTTVPMLEMLAPIHRLRAISIGLGLAAVALGALVAFLTARSISRPIDDIVRHLDACSTETMSAAGQVSHASQSLAAGSSEQASSLEETSASLEEMSSMTKRNAESATQANGLARTARASADAGATDMESMGRAMQDIKTSSDDIAKIIKTIDAIAFQTNILALNAAVEAARAGEAGLGFAVVAEEVRALAQRSAVASKETADKIESAITKTAQGVQISGQVTTRLAEIVEQVRQVDGLIAEVATASREQNQGVGQINAAITQMDKVVQTNAASAEESAAAAEELNAQALSLNEIISQLRHLVAGGSKGKADANLRPAAAEPDSAPAESLFLQNEDQRVSTPPGARPRRSDARLARLAPRANRVEPRRL